MNLQAQPGYNILNTPLVSTPLSNEGNSNFTTPTATNSTPPVHGSVPILGGTPELGVLFANGAFDVTGQPFVIADHEITNYASDAGVSIRGVGLIDLGDASKDAGVETDNTPLTASKKLGLADNTDTAKLRDALRQRRSANQAKSTERADITYDFSAVPLEQLLDKYSELVGRNILRSSAGPEAVSKDATVTLKTQSPLTRSEAAAALEMVLGMNGITVVPVGDKFDKVVVEARAGMEGGIITTNANNLPESSKMVTQIVQVKNTDIKELADVLQPFSKTPKSVVALPSTQTLILRDSAENVDRMAEMIKKIDVPSLAAIKPEVIKIKYGLASDVASALSALGASGGTAIGRSTSAANFGGPSERASFQNNLNKVVQDAAGAGSSQILAKTKIIADERSNSLLIFANDDDKKKIEDILKKLDVVTPQPALPPPVPQPEVLTSTNIFSTFSLNVSDASFKLAAASLQNGAMPDAASIRSEEFINAFDYRDPEPAPGAPIGFAWERAGYPFAHHRDLLRFSVKTAAQGRQDGRPLNLVLLLDKSGSMERADRVEIIQQALRVLASQLHAQDTLSVVVFARTARLWVDGVPGSQAGEVAQGLSRLTPEGGTNLEEAMRLAYATALRHYQAKGDNRVVLLTDGAANLGDVNPETLQQKVEANGKQGIALDCFGVGWDGYNDNLMETLSRVGHGRYGFINTPEEAATEFAGKLAGALRVAASDVKVQVEFNPNRVTAYRQIGYARHQLTKEQFRDNTVAAAQIGAAESGNALYTVEVNPAGDGPLCTVHVRFRLPGTTDYQEHAWDVPYTGTAVTLDQASPALRLAATASAFSEWLAASPYAGEVTPDQLLADLRGVPEVYGADALPKKLEWMIRQAKSISGK
jgi:Mg-chelatase subunit ChlD